MQFKYILSSLSNFDFLNLGGYQIIRRKPRGVSDSSQKI